MYSSAQRIARWWPVAHWRQAARVGSFVVRQKRIAAVPPRTPRQNGREMSWPKGQHVAPTCPMSRWHCRGTIAGTRAIALKYGSLCIPGNSRQSRDGEPWRALDSARGGSWGQCRLTRSRVLAGERPSWVIVSREPSIEPCGATGNRRVDASARQQARCKGHGWSRP